MQANHKHKPEAKKQNLLNRISNDQANDLQSQQVAGKYAAGSKSVARQSWQL